MQQVAGKLSEAGADFLDNAGRNIDKGLKGRSNHCFTGMTSADVKQEV